MGNRVAVTRMEVFSGSLDDPDGPIATGSGVYNVLRKGDRR
jgi:acyl-coenzyme A thioesterase PaaI-like protein